MSNNLSNIYLMFNGTLNRFLSRKGIREEKIAKRENRPFWKIIRSVEQEKTHTSGNFDCRGKRRGNVGGERLNKFVWAIEWAADGYNAVVSHASILH